MIRSKLRNKFLKDKNEQSTNDYQKQSNLCVELIRRARLKHFSSLDPNLVVDNKKFCKTVKLYFSYKISHRDIISLTEDGKTIIVDLQIAEIFNNYFINIIRTLCDRNVSTEPGLAFFFQFLQQSINSKIIPASYLIIKKWIE